MGTSQAVPAKTGAFTYDGFGWFYDRFWGGAYHHAVLDLMRRVLFPALPPAAGILDLCCGTGHLTRLLAGYGHHLTGIDNSSDMLDFARRNVPEANFLLADARSFQLPPQFHAAVSTFDSLNHLLAPEDLLQAFRCVHACLLDGGHFLFDLNTEEAYKTQWNKSAAEVRDNSAYFIRGSYDPSLKLGSTEITAFRRTSAWTRVDLRLFQRYHPPTAVRSALREAGFTGIAVYQSGKHFQIAGNTGIGRVFFHARKGLKYVGNEFRPSA